MEIRTCEEYVLAVLENTENELERVKEESENTILELTNEIKKLSRIIELLNPKVEYNSDGEGRIDTCSNWESIYPESYKELSKLLKTIKNDEE